MRRCSATATRDSEKDYLALVEACDCRARQIEPRLGRDRGDRRRVVASASLSAPGLRASTSRAVFRPFCRPGASAVPAPHRPHASDPRPAAQGWPVVGDLTYGEPRWRPIAGMSLAASPPFRTGLHSGGSGASMTRARRDRAPVPADMALLGAIGRGAVG
jgi:hypothetical protein